MAEEIRAALSIRTAALRGDVIKANGGRPETKKQRLRARFAMRFGQEQSESGEALNRAEQVREAFSSPFWPFVLATTSMGQEGLDFPTYCHAVLHWNLPANPVDLEQREGRVHRYTGHAVRKNIAKRYGVPRVAPGEGSWALLFDHAKKDTTSTSEVIPFWVYALEGGASIERHVPAMPLSRDASRYEALRKSLAVYRMVFGQARQEDLVSYLLTHIPEASIRSPDELRVDLSPPPLAAAR